MSVDQPNKAPRGFVWGVFKYDAEFAFRGFATHEEAAKFCEEFEATMPQNVGRPEREWVTCELSVELCKGKPF